MQIEEISMKYERFKKELSALPVFESRTLDHLGFNTNTLRPQLSRWLKQGKVTQLKRGLYTFSSHNTPTCSRHFLAGHMLHPSYVSLESALSFYGVIPEKVHSITSITTKKTQQHTNTFGLFTYRHIKQNCFSHYIALKDEFGYTFFMATAEKAIVDFLYYKLRKIASIETSLFEEHYRFQNLDQLDTLKLKSIAQTFQQKKLNTVIQQLIRYIKDNYD